MATGGATRPVRDDWTCTIRRDTGAWPGYVAEKLFPSTLLPVCTPALAARLRRPSDLLDATLLVVSHLADDWPCWFKAAGMQVPFRPASEVKFESNAMAMQAVLDGVGVAIAQLAYVSDALTAGRLVAPFPTAAYTSDAWFLQYRPVRESDAALLAFRGWLLDEAERQRQVEAKLLRQSAPN
jgi:LysR family glycine cleavage system transcriptional activator/LysR family transcriptional regulator of beta-lactamase